MILALAAFLLAATEPAMTDGEVWNEGVSFYRDGDVTNALKTLRPLLLSKTHGARAAEVIAKLEAGGFISRVRSATDGRQLDIQLTTAGTEKARELVAAKLAFENEAFACLDEEERAELLDMLDRIAANWRAIDAREREEAC